MIARFSRSWTVVLTMAMITAGCESGSPNKPNTALQRGEPFESDIPVPAGFRLMDEASEDRSTGTYRLYLRHLYEGRAGVHAIRRFYRAQMPLAQWTLVSDGNVKGNIVMRYEKAAESCTIHITGRDSVMAATSQVQVVVAREERGQPPTTARKAP